MLGTVKASPKIAPPLTPAEAKLLEDVQATRRPSFWGRFFQAFNYAFGTVTRQEFDRVCLKVAEELTGKSMDPDAAAAKATRLVKAYTQAQAGCIVCKCDYSDQAVVTIYLGDPASGFLFNKAITLKDPRGVKRV